MAKLENLLPELNYEKVTENITNCIKRYFKESGAEGIVLGLSGGIDSSVTAALLVKAIGSPRVTGLIMPEKESNTKDIEDAKIVAEHLGIKYYVMNITGIVEETLKLFGENYEDAPKIPKGNVKARGRMIVLYYYANKMNYLVAATGDKSEYYLGYFTKWGDAAGDIYPIIGLYKTQVRKLGAYLGLPSEIVKKPSSPGLWPGQTAEGELGLSYEIIDPIIYYLVEKQKPIGEVAATLGIDEKLVKDVWNRIISTQHKRSSLQACNPFKEFGE